MKDMVKPTDKQQKGSNWTRALAVVCVLCKYHNDEEEAINCF